MLVSHLRVVVHEMLLPRRLVSTAVFAQELGTWIRTLASQGGSNMSTFLHVYHVVKLGLKLFTTALPVYLVPLVVRLSQVAL